MTRFTVAVLAALVLTGAFATNAVARTNPSHSTTLRSHLSPGENEAVVPNTNWAVYAWTPEYQGGGSYPFGDWDGKAAGVGGTQNTVQLEVCRYIDLGAWYTDNCRTTPMGSVTEVSDTTTTWPMPRCTWVATWAWLSVTHNGRRDTASVASSAVRFC
jgi:hypothetical protein